ncbi:MAG: glycine betaine ABC transporter substrate-binding protein [Desulfohalobiaceae bacterium]
MKGIVGFLICGLVGALMLMVPGADAAADDKAVRLGYVQWSCATAASNVVKAVLEEEMGYECTLVPMQAEEIWLSTASKDIDGFVCAWLPSLHQHYYGKVGYRVLDLGPNLQGTKVGLVVPEYVSIDSIAQLSDHAQRFDSHIIGIDPGAGVMGLSKEAIEEYQLQDMELVPGSGVSMTKTLQQKIQDREWVVVTGWTPHWKFAKWDLKYLRDPQGVYGGAEAIHTVVRRGLEEDKPRVYSLLDNFSWSPEDIQQVMQMIQESGEPYSSAAAWARQNPEQVQAWIPD